MPLEDAILYWRREFEDYTYLSSQIEYNLKQIEQMQDAMNNLHGIDYSRVRVQVQHDGKPDSFYDLMERKDKLVEATRGFQERKKALDDLLGKMSEEEREIMSQRYIQKRKLRKMGDDFGYEVNSMHNHIMAIIRKAIKKEG